MRRTFLVAAILAAASPAFGQAEKNEDAERALTKLGNDTAVAYTKADTAFFDRVLADEWTIIDPMGEVSNKERQIRELKDGTFVVKSMDNKELKVRIYGDAAVVTGCSEVKAKYKGNDFSSTDRWTDVYVKRDGKWRCVSTQVTGISGPDAKKP